MISAKLPRPSTPSVAYVRSRSPAASLRSQPPAPVRAARADTPAARFGAGAEDVAGPPLLDMWEKRGPPPYLFCPNDRSYRSYTYSRLHTVRVHVKTGRSGGPNVRFLRVLVWLSMLPSSSSSVASSTSSRWTPSRVVGPRRSHTVEPMWARRGGAPSLYIGPWQVRACLAPSQGDAPKCRSNACLVWA